MLLLETAERRKSHHNLLLALFTSVNAGLVNVVSVIAFFAFSSNVTGHVAIVAEEIVKGHWHQVSVVAVWLLMFLVGAFVANASVTMVGRHHPRLGCGAPLFLQMLVITGVAFYGHQHYRETLAETEFLVGSLLFAMGLQNSGVSSVTNNVVRTTHLTGLMTDLGMELSMMLQARFRQDQVLRFKLALHLLIFSGYLGGGLLGGALYLSVGFPALYLGSGLLGIVLLHDFVIVRMNARAGSSGFADRGKLQPGE